MVTRGDLARLAELRLDEAKILLGAGRFSGAYYLAGYAVECALKACIAKAFQPNIIPTKAFVNDIYTHDLAKLVGLAGLNAALREAETKDRMFAVRWGVVSNWNEQSRYEVHDTVSAGVLVTCCEEVLKWIRQHW